MGIIRAFSQGEIFMPKRTLTALSLIAFSFGASAAVTVTTGAGYVPMVEKLVEVCKNETAASAATSVRCSRR